MDINETMLLTVSNKTEIALWGWLSIESRLNRAASPYGHFRRQGNRIMKRLDKIGDAGTAICQ